MNRRVVAAAICLVLGLSHAVAQPSYKISAEQLQQAISQRFPVRHRVEGLLNFDVQEPRLRLLPEKNRVASDMVVDVAGPALRRSYTGSLALDFELRFEPSDQSIRAHRLQVHSLQLSGLPPRTAELLDAMGLQPATITVTSQGLVVGFETKQLR